MKPSPSKKPGDKLSFKEEAEINRLAKAYFLPNGQFGGEQEKNALAKACLELAEIVNSRRVHLFPRDLNNDRDDIAQETITSLLDKKDVNPDNFYNLLKHALRNKTIDYGRRRIVREEPLGRNSFNEGRHTSCRSEINSGEKPRENPGIDSWSYSDERVIERKPTRRDIDLEPLIDAIKTILPRDPKLSQILELKSRGLAEPEIAKITGMPLGSVKSQVLRFREYVLGSLKDRFGEEIAIISNGELAQEKVEPLVNAVIHRLSEAPEAHGFRHRARTAANVDDKIAR